MQEEKVLAWKLQGFRVLYDKIAKYFWMWDMVQHVWENIAENLDFLEKKIFIRESTKSAVHRCSGINLKKIPVMESYYSKVAGLKPVIFLQQSSATGVFLWNSILTQRLWMSGNTQRESSKK